MSFRYLVCSLGKILVCYYGTPPPTHTHTIINSIIHQNIQLNELCRSFIYKLRKPNQIWNVIPNSNVCLWRLHALFWVFLIFLLACIFDGANIKEKTPRIRLYTRNPFNEHASDQNKWRLTVFYLAIIPFIDITHIWGMCLNVHKNILTKWRSSISECLMNSELLKLFHESETIKVVFQSHNANYNGIY